MDLDFFGEVKEILEELKEDACSSQVVCEIENIPNILIWYEKGCFDISKWGIGDDFDRVKIKNIEDAAIYICGIDRIYNIEQFYIESK